MDNYPLTLLYDASCPVCAMEMHALRDRDLAKNAHTPQLRFVDISKPDFDPMPYGASLLAMNTLIHAQRPDGSMVIGVEVFRLAYDAVGLGHWVAPTGWRWLKPLVDRGYALFAAHRYGFSRLLRPAIRWLVERRARRALHHAQACSEGTCKLSHLKERS
jgi:predicted DCC family thiol-disulfide oxidoreductase YuxK